MPHNHSGPGWGWQERVKGGTCTPVLVRGRRTGRNSGSLAQCLVRGGDGRKGTPVLAGGQRQTNKLKI